MCIQGDGAAALAGQVAHTFSVGICNIAVLCITPPGEGVACAGEGIGGETLLHVIGEGLVIHIAVSAVGIKGNGVGSGHPLGVERDNRSVYISKVIHSGSVSVDNITVLRITPPGKVIACAGEGVGGKTLLHAISEGLAVHFPVSAVGIKGNGVGNGRPLCIQGDGAAAFAGQVAHTFSVGICNIAVLCFAPSGEGIACAGEGVGGQ